ncbi:MAG: hypothetical protein VB125_05395 [Burkholderia sp.]
MPEIEDMGITSPLRSIYATTPNNAVRQHHHEIVALGDALRAQRASVAL